MDWQSHSSDSICFGYLQLISSPAEVKLAFHLFGVDKINYHQSKYWNRYNLLTSSLQDCKLLYLNGNQLFWQVQDTTLWICLCVVITFSAKQPSSYLSMSLTFSMNALSYIWFNKRFVYLIAIWRKCVVSFFFLMSYNVVHK